MNKSASQKKKIVLVISGLGSGGAERIICGLASHCAARGWDPTLVSFGPAENSYYPLDPLVRLVQLDIPSNPNAFRQTLRRVRALRRIVNEAKPLIVVSFLTKINVVAILATLGSATRIVISERNNANLQYVHPLWRLFRFICYPMSYCFVAPTNGLLESFPWAVRLRGRVIPNPVDPWFHGLSLDRRSDRTIVAVGRLVHQKGFDLLLLAFAQIAPVRPDWSLVIWGEGEERDSLLRLRGELGLARSVSMPGVTPSPGEWARGGEVFALSSRFEGFANVVAEGMAAGLAVIAFDCPWGPGELIEHEKDGLLIPPGDVDALAAGLLRLTGDEALRRELGAAARRNIVRIRPEVVMAGWDSLLQEATCEEGARNARLAS